ncbi:MAG: RNA polymerase sigma factor, partial [Candidatus Staskawiczbacteria bacterium]|nr:RNA polymerase sigma factor [Candidatus Staskawiczbacteria bacterium]
MPITSETSADKELIQRYLKGESEALDFLIAKYLKQIYSFVYNNVGGQAEAEDITQEVFIKIWKNIRKFDQNKSFKPWIFQIAKNTSIDFLRKKKSIPFSRFENEKGQNPLLDNIAVAPLNLIEKLNEKKTVLAAMQGLNEKEQKVINLRHNDGLSFREIAEIFKESVNTVKSRYRRSLASLKKNIEENKGPK